MPILSFCITTKNRFSQIQKTLPQNLKDNFELKEYVEFILVDFGSTDGLKSWIKANLMKYIECGYLKYFYTDELKYWHASIAKNTSHILSDSIILTNLDGDNYTGREGGGYIIKKFISYKYPIVLHQFSNTYHDGSFGRISMRKKDFVHIGGYNEKFQPMGYEDEDLIKRLNIYGITHIKDPNHQYNKTLPNTKEDSISLCNSNLTWTTMNDMNRITSFENITRKDIIANQNIMGIREKIYDIYENPVFVKI